MAIDQLSIEKKIEQIKFLFENRPSEEKIQCLLNLNRSLAPYPDNLKTETHRIAGCQSTLYLSSSFDNGKVYFIASADALISGGLAALLISVYSGESPRLILNTPPNFLLDFGILASLSPSRSNGLAHIHRRMKNDALKFLLSTTNSVELNSSTI